MGRGIWLHGDQSDIGLLAVRCVRGMRFLTPARACDRGGMPSNARLARMRPHSMGAERTATRLSAKPLQLLVDLECVEYIHLREDPRDRRVP